MNEIAIINEEQSSAEVFAQIVDNLKARYKKKTPKAFKKERQGKGGKSFTYVDRRYVEQWLNENYGDRWSFEVVADSAQIIGDNVHVLGTLSLQERTGVIRKFSCYGSKEAIPHNGNITTHPYLKSAESDALKRCAAMVGCAADVYVGETVSDEESKHIANPQDIAWFVNVMCIASANLPPEKLTNLPKQFSALAEGKLTKQQIIQNYAKLGIDIS